MRISHPQSSRMTRQLLHKYASSSTRNASDTGTQKSGSTLDDVLNRLRSSGQSGSIRDNATASTLVLLGQRVETIKKEIPMASSPKVKSFARELEKISNQILSIAPSALGKTAGTDGKATTGTEKSSTPNQSGASVQKTGQTTPQNTSGSDLSNLLSSLANKVKQAIGQFSAHSSQLTASVRNSLSRAEKQIDSVIEKVSASRQASTTGPHQGIAAYTAPTTGAAGSAVDTQA